MEKHLTNAEPRFSVGDRVAYLASPTAIRSSVYVGVVQSVRDDGLVTIENVGYGTGSRSAVPMRALRRWPDDKTPAEMWSLGDRFWSTLPRL